MLIFTGSNDPASPATDHSNEEALPDLNLPLEEDSRECGESKLYILSVTHTQNYQPPLCQV
jgi:hypothetical protein